MKSDFLRPDNVEFSKIGKFTSVGIQIVVSFIGLPNRKNIQNVVENNKKYRYFNFPISPGYFYCRMESGGGIELEEKKERRCGGLKLSFSLFFVNKLNIPIHNDPNWHRDDIPTL